jgi:alkanesulfonate monooxygenase SsuD/methylene tetrahydromethanopterin reductase-like flavin-dependent oxidoreductase (luciferase family)
LFTSHQQSFVNLRRGRPGKLPPPIDDIESYWTPVEKAGLEQALACALVGNAETVAEGLDAFIAKYRPDELIVVSNIYDHGLRKRSYEILAQVRDRMP